MLLRTLINEYVEIFFHLKVSMNTGIIFFKQLQPIKIKISFSEFLGELMGTTDKMPQPIRDVKIRSMVLDNLRTRPHIGGLTIGGN